ncbi:radical SAM protein [Desulfoferrobacter suflitae]|uniref:radical SAM protein n=1 Tax=Desulfoferrobacter suflitae TaxID=2865782 RepID=UPI002164A32F|nr:radical SAM protein [Desulfoferrobacter suflitae]MCK8601218.1 radical SAM protein [Desulfoferrobacter suflitae]
MLIKYPGRLKKSSICLVCGSRMVDMSASLEVCPDCIRNRWDESLIRIEALHTRSRRVFQLPAAPPASPDGLSCTVCVHRCRMAEEELGYCGIRTGSRESLRQDGRFRARLSHYYDPLPTNCVADWVCPGGTGAGYPLFANDRGPEVGFYNLAVFFEACNLNCLFCQNWHFKKSEAPSSQWYSVEALVATVNRETSCVCYFGGDPVPQLPYAIRASERMREKYPDKIIRICWETNGSMHPAWLKRVFRLSLESGGCIKVDLKAWNPNIHHALCGFDNHRILENFQLLARMAAARKDPPVLLASTLLVPGYVDDAEIFQLASFIAALDPDIPYALLGFAPQFCLEDFPTTSLAQAEACMDAAKRAGLQRVRIGNRHLLH